MTMITILYCNQRIGLLLNLFNVTSVSSILNAVQSMSKFLLSHQKKKSHLESVRQVTCLGPEWFYFEVIPVLLMLLWRYWCYFYGVQQERERVWSKHYGTDRWRVRRRRRWRREDRWRSKCRYTSGADAIVANATILFFVEVFDIHLNVQLCFACLNQLHI